MNAERRPARSKVISSFLGVMVAALVLLLWPDETFAQTRVPPLRITPPPPLRITTAAPVRATPVTPKIPCVHLSTEGVPGASFIGGAIKERCFAFPGDAGAVVSISLHSAGAIPAMALQGPDGAVVARSNSGRIDGQMLSADGPHAIIVSGTNIPRTIRIEASVTAQGSTLGPEQPHPSEQGTAIGQAPLCTGVLSFSQPQTGMVPFPGEACNFTFNARRGQSVYAWMESLSDGLQPELTLLDPTGRVLSSGHVVNSRTRYAAAFDLPVSGVYTVVAGSQGGQSAGAFKLTLNEGASAFCGDVLRPGVLTEVVLPTGGRQCALVVDVPSSRRLRFELLPLDGAAAPNWVVDDASGEVVASDDDPLAIWTAEETGRYTATLSPTSRQRARILVQMTPVIPPTIYYVGPSCGGALTAGKGSGSRPEVMTLAGNVCDYTFSGARGETIWVAASKDNASSPFQPVLVLMKPGFAAADPPEATGDNTVFSGMAVIRDHILAQTGRYTVRVSDYGDDDTGSFFIMLWKR